MKNRPSDSPASQRMSLRLLPCLLCLLLTACRAVFSAADAAGTGSAESSTAESTASEKAQIALTDKTDLPDKTDLSPEDPAGLAAAISEEYGVRVLLGDDVPLVYKDYTVSCLDDPQKEAAALRELDSTLSLYPPGFFTSVKEGYCDSITICLAQKLHAINDENYIESANAFTTVQDKDVWLVLNADRELERGILIHELTHVVDYRLLGMHQLREEEWNQLNPPSFSYYNSYLDENGTDLRLSGSEEYTALAEKDPGRVWFCDAYSKTFAMEDRARLMEYLLEKNDSPKILLSSPHIQTKLRFYFYTLRQAFGNARWPEETVWEAELHKTAP